MDFPLAPSMAPQRPQGFDYNIPDMEMLNNLLNQLPPDPSIPIRPRPSTEVLIQRKKRITKFWRPRNLRMVDDEKLYKLQKPVPERSGGDEIGAAETLVLNDPYILCEKTANMLASQEPTINCIAKDAGMKDAAQKVEDFLYWWRDEANVRWTNNLNNNLSRDEVYYLALRGWLTGRIMLDPGDPDFPWRYDVIDPIQVFPQRGPKGLRWLFHVYKDAKINVLNDLGWSNDLVTRVEDKLSSISDEADVEVASYFDDVWHVLYLDDEEIWSAPHNYGFVPWCCVISFGPPIRRVDPQYGGTTSTDATNKGSGLYRSSYGGSYKTDYTAWWGVSVFQGIKDIYGKLNKLASAVMTEAMKAPNPPVVIYTNSAGEAEGKVIDTAIGATNYLVMGQEEYKLVEYGFKPSELAPLMQMLLDARNRGALPAVMYGEGANYLSGFAVSLLQAGSRDIILPLIKSHEHYLQNLHRYVLQMTMELYPYPINMVETDPQTGARTRLTVITQDDIRLVGCANRVTYANLFPQDEMQKAQIATMLLDKKIISLDTARGDAYLGLRNPSLENRKVLGDIAYYDPEVVKASIPLSLLITDPVLYVLWTQAQIKKAQQEMQMAQMAMMTGKAPPPEGGAMPPPGGESPTGVAPETTPPPSAATPPRPQRAQQIGNAPF